VTHLATNREWVIVIELSVDILASTRKDDARSDQTGSNDVRTDDRSMSHDVGVPRDAARFDVAGRAASGTIGRRCGAK
jgi:hypothetical protein